MKDYISGREIDMQGMLDVAASTQARHYTKFDMNSWGDAEPDCGTCCCMIGSFIADHKEDPLHLDPNTEQPFMYGEQKREPVKSIMKRFGLSDREVRFLFLQNHLNSCTYGHVSNIRLPGYSKRDSKDAVNLRKRAALSRLRKFIYYKMRKSELLADYEKARRTGDVGVNQQVLQEV